MPAGYLHRRCAEQACAASGVTPVKRDALVLGAQGPDPLFTLGMFPLRLSSKPSALGGTLHKRRTGAFLTALCRRAKAAGDVERAYALGFLTHYALDSTVHPYVYAHSYRPDGRYSSSMHMGLEKQWDSLYYRRDGHRGTPISMPGAAETEADWPAICALLSGAICDTFPEEDAPPALIRQALEGTVKANRLTHSPRGIKYGLAWAGERLLGKPGLLTSQIPPARLAKKDIENEGNQPWHSMAEPDIARTESLPELLEMAVRRAAELLGGAGRYFGGEIDEAALSALIGNVGYDTGVTSLP